MRAKGICPVVITIVLTVFLNAYGNIDEDAKVKRISGGEEHTLVITGANTVWGCGDNEFYQLGIGNNTEDQKVLVQVSGVNDVNFIDVSAGWLHSLALDVNGFVWAVGDN